MSVKPLRVRQAEATRSLLITTARGRFAELGYSATSIDDIITRAGVAKGALYHHFSGKDELFRAVYDEVLAETATAAVDAALDRSEPWEAARAGLATFLDACLDSAFRRIVIVDSVVVLQGDPAGGLEKVELPMLRSVLSPLLALGLVAGAGIEPLAHVALGGLYGAALFITRSESPEQARAEVEIVLDAVIRGLQISLDDTAE